MISLVLVFKDFRAAREEMLFWSSTTNRILTNGLPSSETFCYNSPSSMTIEASAQ